VLEYTIYAAALMKDIDEEYKRYDTTAARDTANSAINPGSIPCNVTFCPNLEIVTQ
jgi:hypothetical protein